MPCAAAAALERRSEPASANEAVAHRVAAMTAEAFIVGKGGERGYSDRGFRDLLLDLPSQITE